MARLTRRLAVGLLATLAAVLPLSGCKVRDTGPAFGETGDVKVAVSFPALYSLAANVVGDTGTVKSVKSTQGAHGGEVTDGERRVIASADVLFINGLGLDDEFERKLREGSANPTITVVKLGDTLNKKKHSLMIHSDEPCVDGDHAHDHGGHDPHVWMGVEQVKRYVDYIADALGEKYPHHKDTFFSNAKGYKEKLDALKQEGEAALAGTKPEARKLVTAHGSMAYFADTFDMTVVDTIQKTVGSEPTKKQMDELVAKCKKEGVRVIAAEPQFSKLGGVKTLAEELKRAGVTATVIELDNLETATAEELKADWYEVKMRANIAALKDAFGK
jgi:ABC-type Zn uptake system ZnuABC Zn-binding protein ZnuA